MKFNFRKITSVLASVIMLGSTIGIAAAAGTYPAPFISGGAANVAVVVGTAAQSSDYLAAVNVGQSLQSELSKQTATGGTSGGASATGESVLFNTDTNKLNVGDNLTQVKPVAIDEDNLPTILATGTYSNAENEDFDYEQKIDIDPKVGLSHFADSDYEDKESTVGIRIPKGNYVFNYTLDFTDPAEDDGGTGSWTDYEDTTLKMLGQTYDIVDAKNTSNNRPYLVLMRGVEKAHLTLSESKTFTISGSSYEVSLSYVDSDECQFKVNGESTDKLTKGSTDKLTSGMRVGVTEVYYSVGAVTEIIGCDFYIGADKVELDDTQEIKMNDEVVDNLRTYITETYSGSTTKIDKFVIEWKADEDLFITNDSSLAMPGFGAVKFDSGVLTIPKEEETTLEGDGDKTAQLTTYIKSGKVTIDLLTAGNTTTFNKIGGDGSGEGLLTKNSSGNAGVEAVYDLGDNYSGHKYFPVTYWDGSAAGETYLIEITDADATDGVDFRDVVDTSKTWTNTKNGTSISIGSAIVTLNKFNEDSWANLSTGASTYFDRIITKEGMMIYLPVANNSVAANIGSSPQIAINDTRTVSYALQMWEENKDGTLKAGDMLIANVSMSSNNKPQVGYLEVGNMSGGDDIEDNDDDNLMIGWLESELATKTLYDTDPDEDTLKVVYHGSQVYGNVFLAESTSIVTSSGGTGASVTELGSVTVKDNEISSAQSKNLIVVGGSCINTVAAKLLGSDTPLCGADFTTKTGVGADQFLVQVVASPYTTGKVAMLVAGYEAADTAKAVTYVTKEPNVATDSGTTLKKVTATYADVTTA